MKIYWVLKPDGETKGYWKEGFPRKFPKTNASGIVFLKGFPYVPDETLIVRRYVRPLKYLRLVKKEFRYYFWSENEPAQLALTKEFPPGSIGLTGEVIKTYAKSEHLRRLVQPEMNWLLVGFICLLVGAMCVAIGYSYGLTVGTGK
jgi:hypothetical protein